VVASVEAQEEKISYEDHIKQIMLESCAGCHNQERAKNGLKLDTYAGIFEGGSSGPAIVKGNPSGSLLYQVVAHVREPFMPYGEDKLPDATIEIIRRWIESGAPQTKDDNSFVPSAPATPMTLDPTSLALPEGAAAMPENIRTEPYWWTERPNAIRAIACSPYAPLIAVGGHRQVFLHHAETFARLGVLDFPEGDIMTVRFSRDGSIVFAGGGMGAASGRVVGWNVATGARVFEIGDETDVVLDADLSADNTMLALGGPDRIVRVYDLSTAATVFEVAKHTDWVTSISFSPDGVLLATGDRAGGAFVWEALTGREFHTLPTHNGAVTSIAWRADSALLATAGDDGFIRLLDAENGREQRAWQSHGGVLALDWLRDGRMASCGRDRVVRVWRADGSEERALEPLADLATAVAATHDGARIVAGCWNGEVRVHATGDGARLADLRANPPTSLEEQAIAAAAEVARLEQQIPGLAAAADAATQQAARLAAKAAGLETQGGEAKAALDAHATTAQQAEQTITQAETLIASIDGQAAAKSAAVEQANAVMVAQDEAVARAQVAMRVAIEARLAAERLLEAAQATGDAAAIEQAKASLATAAQLADGAIAIAERAAMERAQAQIAVLRAQAEHELWLAHAQPQRDHAAAGREQALLIRAEHLRLQELLNAAAATAQQARGEATAAAAAATAAIDAKTQAEIALAAARDAATAAAAAWEAKKQAILANSGRVE
jgi:hypothetical protein